MLLKNERSIRLGLLLGSGLVTLLVIELFLRLISYNYTPLRIQVQYQTDWRDYHIFEDNNFVYDPDLIWRPKEGASVFNSQGYRGRELSLDKEPGAVRIFAVGDSNTLGWNTSDGANWPLSLDQLLHETDNRFTVINAGVWGYSSFQGLRRFQQILPFQPDLVFISFGGNDPHFVTISDSDFINRRSGIFAFYLQRALNKLKVGQFILELGDKFFLQHEQRLIHRVSLSEYEANLEEIIRLAETRNIRVVLLTRPFIGASPDPLWWKNFAPAYNAATIEIAQRHHIPVIDIYTYFENKAEYFQDESHFNKAGHQVAAQIIYEHIEPLLTQLQPELRSAQ